MSRTPWAAAVLTRAGASGFVSFPAHIAQDNSPIDKVRGKVEKFAEHYKQPRLFFDSQTKTEKAHIVGGFRFELSKMTLPAIRKRMVASLRNVSDELAQAVAHGLGIELPDAVPRATKRTFPSEVKVSPALSLRALPGDRGIATRRVAIVIAEGISGRSITTLIRELSKAGAVPQVRGVVSRCVLKFSAAGVCRSSHGIRSLYYGLSGARPGTEFTGAASPRFGWCHPCGTPPPPQQRAMQCERWLDGYRGRRLRRSTLTSRVVAVSRSRGRLRHRRVRDRVPAAVAEPRAAALTPFGQRDQAMHGVLDQLGQMLA